MAARCGSSPATRPACATPRPRRWRGFSPRRSPPGSKATTPIRRFARQVVAAKSALLRFLIDAAGRGQAVAGYGAPAKGNTLLNYCGVGPELIAFTVDRSPHKQGMLLPGTRIPVRGPEAIMEEKPDYGPDPALEPAGRDHHPDDRRARMGWPLRGGHSDHTRAGVTFTPDTHREIPGAHHGGFRCPFSIPMLWSSRINRGPRHGAAWPLSDQS